MSGCFGNDPEDRAKSQELNEYLDSLEDCDDECDETDDDAESFASEKDCRNTDRRYNP